MSAAEQEYDICAVHRCQGFPVAVWEAVIAIGAPPTTLVAATDLPLCERHCSQVTDGMSGRVWLTDPSAISRGENGHE